MNKIFLSLKIIILIAILILIFSIGFAKIDGNSMKPNLNHGDVVIYTKNVRNIKRFDIIIIELNNKLFIKRVIGLPNENIKYFDNKLYVNNILIDEPFQKSLTKDFGIQDILLKEEIPNNKILVLGDNRLYSYDSRNFGLIDISNIKGIMLFKLH